jgi:hypothetical protein
MDESLKSRYARGRSRTRVEKSDQNGRERLGRGRGERIARNHGAAGFHTIPHHPTRMHVRGAPSATIGAMATRRRPGSSKKHPPKASKPVGSHVVGLGDDDVAGRQVIGPHGLRELALLVALRSAARIVLAGEYEVLQFAGTVLVGNDRQSLAGVVRELQVVDSVRRTGQLMVGVPAGIVVVIRRRAGRSELGVGLRQQKAAIAFSSPLPWCSRCWSVPLRPHRASTTSSSSNSAPAPRRMWGHSVEQSSGGSRRSCSSRFRRPRWRRCGRIRRSAISSRSEAKRPLPRGH